MRELLRPSCFLLVRLSLFLSATSWIVNQWWELRLDGHGYILRITHDGVGLYRTGWSTEWSAQVSPTPDAYFHRGFAPRPVVFSDQPLDQEFFRQVPGILCWRFEQQPSIWFVGIRHWLLFAVNAFAFAVMTVVVRRDRKSRPQRPVDSDQSAGASPAGGASTGPTSAGPTSASTA